MSKRKVLKLDKNKKFIVVKEKLKKRPRDKGRGWSRFLSFAGLTVELGFVIALPIAGGAILGRWLDQKFGLSPKMTLSFIFLGVFLAISNLYQIIKISFQK